MPILSDDDWANAKAFGSYIDAWIVEGDDDESIPNSKLDEVRYQLEDSGLAEILKNYTLFPEEEIALLLDVICIKSDVLPSSSKWKSISRVIYYEYMNPKPTGEIFKELSL